MKVRYIDPHTVFNTDTGSKHVGGEDLVTMAMEAAVVASQDCGEPHTNDHVQLQCLIEIVGRLVDKLPDDQILEVVGLQYTLERTFK